MHKLHDLKELLCEELEKYADKQDLTSGDLTMVDTLAHATKNVCKIIEFCDEEEYSGNYPEDHYRDGGSYAPRGRMGNVRRDNRGRYSSERGYSRDHRELVDELRDMMRDVTDERTRQRLQKFATKIEEMG